MISRELRIVRAVLSALVVLLAYATPATADFDIVPDTTWTTNGFVRAVVRAGDRIYIGGRFTSVRPCPPGTACPGAFAVNNVAAFDANTGAGISTFRPAVTRESAPIVYALAVLNGKLFIGGKFTSVEGQARMNFAAVDAITGELDPNVDAQIGTDSTHHVRTMLASDTRVYVGGRFGFIDGVARARLAAFDINGNLDPLWRPRANGLVSSLAFACDGQTIFAGGNFAKAAGSGKPFASRRTIARFDPVSGNLHPWHIPDDAIPNGLTAYDLAPTCERLFVAYAGSNWAYAVDVSDDVGDVIWALKTGGDVQTTAVYNNRVLLGGHFSQIDATDQQNVKRTRFAVVDFDGNIDPWAPSFEGRFLGPWDILVDGNRVWVGGDFTHVSGVAQRGIARFSDMEAGPVWPDEVFVGAGDIALCSKGNDEKTAALLDEIPGTVFTIGDNAYPKGTAEQFANCYDPSWGRHKERTRPAIGNHEYMTAGAEPYLDYFGVPKSYSFDLGNWHIVSLDSMCQLPENGGSCAPSSPTMQWLKADLDLHSTKCTLVYFHHPRWSSGDKQGNTNRMSGAWKIMYAAGVDVVLSAHSHNYERFAPLAPNGEIDLEKGIRSFVVGTGGGDLSSSFSIPKVGSEVRDGSTHGVLKLTLRADDYSWEFIPAEEGEFRDSGLGACH